MSIPTSACREDVAAEHPTLVARLKGYAEQARADLGDRGRPGAGQRGPGRIAAGQQPQPQVLPKRALDVIERVRGGRHWVDDKTDPPREPQESLDAFRVEPGYRVELFAAEPLVMDPVSIAFDRLGRMFVVEYGDYPIGPPDGADPFVAHRLPGGQ